MRLSLIAAVADSGVIGRNNKLPWHLPRDLQRFKRLTTGHHLLIGRKTFEAIGRSLPGRTMVVLTRGNSSLPATVCRVRSLEEAVEFARAAGDTEAFVAGGEEIYRIALPLVDRIYLTRVHQQIEGDAHFPPLDGGEWKEIEREHYPAKGEDSIAVTFLVLDRVARSEGRKRPAL
ncbi:MAG: dihydrofolate reductase [Acidobacteriota bacterium]|nr:dihydrofolate reductase [Acidobacteriota bacterium]